MSSRRRARAKQQAERRPASVFDRNLWLCLGLAIVTLIIFSPVRHSSFINYDDDTYVTANPHVQAGLTPKTIAWALTSTDGDNWHPLTWMSHALDHDLFGDDPAGHHLTSAFIHAINVALLFQLLVAATGMMGRSLMVAALFALHPFNVESVAWVSERKNVLSMLLFLLTLAAYGWYARQPSARRYAVVAALFVLGLAAKPMLVTLPCVLLLLDFWPLNRVEGWNGFSRQVRQEAHRRSNPAQDAIPTVTLFRAVTEKLPLLALSAADAAITVFAQHKGGAMRLALSPAVKLENAVYAYAMYVWKAFWPVSMAPFYPHPAGSLKAWQVASAAVFLAAISVMVVLHRRKRPYLVLGWLWFLGTLVPVIGIIQVGEQAMADRYAYLPLVGIFIIVAWGAAEIFDHMHLTWQMPAMAAGVVALVLGILTWRQIGYWQNSLDLWTHTVAVTSNNFTAEDNLGGALLVQGRYQDALPHFQKACSVNPRDPTCRLDIATILAQQGRLNEAVAEFQRALPLVRDVNVLPLVYENLAIVYSQIHDYANARATYQRVLSLDPQRASSRAALAELDVTEAATKVSEHPSGQAYFHLGEVLQQAGRMAEARVAYEQAAKLDPALRAPSNVLSQ